MLLPERQLTLAVTGVRRALFSSVFNQTILATAMPRIFACLGGFVRYTWTSAAYLVASTIVIPIAGSLSDIYGRRVLLVLGLVIFTFSSIPAGLSQSMNQLVASRALVQCRGRSDSDCSAAGLIALAVDGVAGAF